MHAQRASPVGYSRPLVGPPAGGLSSARPFGSARPSGPRNAIGGVNTQRAKPVVHARWALRAHREYEEPLRGSHDRPLRGREYKFGGRRCAWPAALAAWPHGGHNARRSWLRHGDPEGVASRNRAARSRPLRGHKPNFHLRSRLWRFVGGADGEPDRGCAAQAPSGGRQGLRSEPRSGSHGLRPLRGLERAARSPFTSKKSHVLKFNIVIL